jgi:C1A family cysteine protease
MSKSIITQKGTGCLPQPEDHRDHKYACGVSASSTEPVDLRPFCASVRDQGLLNSCTAFGSTTLVDFVRNKNKQTQWYPSPLFTYYATRTIEGTTELDNGAYIRDAIKSTVQYGTALEREWPYVMGFVNKRPPEEVWASAEKHQTLEYLSVGYSKSQFVGCLREGYPFVFGMNLYSSFMSEETAATGYVRLADPEKEEAQGGHCMLAVGYFFDKSGCDYIIAQNSWGDSWGDKGFCYIPMGCFLRDTFDYWTIRSIENEAGDISDKNYKKPEIIPVPAPIPEPVPVPTVVNPPVPVPTNVDPLVVVAPPSADDSGRDTLGFILALVGTAILIALFFILG